MDRSLTTFHNVPWMSLELLQETGVDAGKIGFGPIEQMWRWWWKIDVRCWRQECFFFGGGSDGSKFSCAMALAYSKLIKIVRALRCWGPVRRSCALQSTHHTPVSLAGFCSCSFGSRPATCGLWFRKCGSYVHVSFDRTSSDTYQTSCIYVHILKWYCQYFEHLPKQTETMNMNMGL